MSVPEGIKAWHPQDSSPEITQSQSRLSRGFLRSAPAAWFPGLSSHWLPFQHSAGIEIRVLEVVPALSIDKLAPDFKPVAGWSLDQESFVLYSSTDSENNLLHTLIPNSDNLIKPVLLEYLARRITISLFGTWAGSEASVLLYQPEFNFNQFKAESYIVIRASINSEQLHFAFGLSRGIVELMDGLWRRQLRASRRSALTEKLGFKEQVQVSVEIARLSLAPQEIASYLSATNLIDLEMPVLNKVILKVEDEAWVAAEIRNLLDRFAFEVSSISPVLPQVAAGTTALTIELGRFSKPALELVEFEQEHAVIESGLSLSSRVNLVIRGEKLAEAELLNYQGRFALKVL